MSYLFLKKFYPLKAYIKLIFLIALLIFLFYLCLAFNRQGLDNPFLKTETNYQSFLLLNIRLPRAIIAIFSGMMLGLSGAIFQIILRNPLASPDILGINAGASIGILINLLFFPFIPFNIGAFCGALFIAFLLYPWHKNQFYQINTQKLLLCGLAVAAFCNASLSFSLANLDIQQAQQLQSLLTGTLANRNWHDVKFILYALFFMPILFFLNKELRYFSLTPEMMINLGINLNFVQKISLIFAIFAASLSVCLAGPIQFIALSAPQIAQLSHFKKPALFPSMIIGALLMLGADFLTLILPTTGRLNVGILTSALGGLYLLFFLYLKTKKARL